jgi:hypothetical protein
MWIGPEKRERRELRSDYISFVDFFLFLIWTVCWRVFIEFHILKNLKQTEQNNWTVQSLDAFW